MIVNLNNIVNVKDFAGIAQGLNYEVKVRSGAYIVNGKSLLGLFSLDLENPVEVEVPEEFTENEKEVFQRFVI